VYASRASTVAERLSIAAVERSLSSRFACSSETFCVWIVSAACELLGAPLRVREVRLLRLAHQQQRHAKTASAQSPAAS
jgi:hypothetical protein